MNLLYIAIFTIGALIYAGLLPARWRQWTLFIASIFVVYRLQPDILVRYLDYIFPTMTIVISVIVWWLTRDPQNDTHREDRISFIVLVAIVIGLSLTRYLIPELRPTASRPPDTFLVILVLMIVSAIFGLIWRLLRDWRGLLTATMLIIVLLFIVLKTAPLAAEVSAIFRSLNAQDVTLASVGDLSWLGFSYVAFRLIHILRERQMGKLPALSLREHMTYVIFFPALTAGPIDRAERFIKDWRLLSVAVMFTAPRLFEGCSRILIGLFKKFVVADPLSLFALNTNFAQQTNSTGSLWLLLYAYAFQLFFDFSGYSDIAIGIGILLGIYLPENFDRPYLKQNIAAFWQSWHITLSNWVRFYVFSPLSRAMLKRKMNALATVLVAQLATMVIIGLWHGVSRNFLVWGLWHGMGLFIHKAWSDRTRKQYLALNQHPRLKQAWTLAGIALTFHFVVLGWVWFALPDLSSALRVWLRLFGIG
jgi:alginate O-acetyltransferase complex protein AlgI